MKLTNGFVAILCCFCSSVTASSFELWFSDTNLKTVLIELANSIESKHKVELALVEKSRSSVRAELLKAKASKALPHMVLFSSENLSLYREISLLPIPSDITTTTIDKKFMNETRIGGANYGIPISVENHLVLYVNRALIENPAANWDAIVEQQRRLTNDGKQFEVFVSADINSSNTLYNFSQYYGGLFLQDTLNFRRDVAMKTLQFYADMQDEKVLPVNCNSDCAVNQFVAGLAPYLIDRVSIFGELQQAMGDQLRVTTIPDLDKQSLATPYTLNVIAFPSTEYLPKHRILRSAIVEYLLSGKMQRALFDRTSLPPVTRFGQRFLGLVGGENSKAVKAQIDASRAVPVDLDMHFVWPGVRKGLDYFRRSKNTEKAASVSEYLVNKSIEDAR